MPVPTSENSIVSTPAAKGNLSFVLQKIDEISFEEREVKPLGPLDVQVNVRQTGICGS
jgi:D-xylulose reductase